MGPAARAACTSARAPRAVHVDVGMWRGRCGEPPRATPGSQARDGRDRSCHFRGHGGELTGAVVHGGACAATPVLTGEGVHVGACGACTQGCSHALGDFGGGEGVVHSAACARVHSRTPTLTVVTLASATLAAALGSCAARVAKNTFRLCAVIVFSTHLALAGVIVKASSRAGRPAAHLGVFDKSS